MRLDDMAELREVLYRHIRRYPRMRPEDAVKLIYQNEFGGGHMIRNPEESLERLREEVRKTPDHVASEMKEDIGNGMARIYLGGIAGVYSPEELNSEFVRSAEMQRGNRARFLNKLKILQQLADENVFGFSSQELQDYLSRYTADGMPAVSHSAQYREAYHPAYRIIETRLSKIQMVQRIKEEMQKRELVLVAIDGRCAGGKTTLAQELSEQYGWSVIHMDHFFLRPEQRSAERYAQPGENVDHERVMEEVLLPLKAGDPVQYRPFNCETWAMDDPVSVAVSPVVLIEGSYACHSKLRPYYHITAFVTVDPQVQLERILRRNGPEMKEIFRERWIPMEEAYFRAFNVPDSCDFYLELP